MAIRCHLLSFHHLHSTLSCRNQLIFSFPLSRESRQSSRFRNPCGLSAIFCVYLRQIIFPIIANQRDQCSSAVSLFPMPAMSRDDGDLGDFWLSFALANGYLLSANG